MKKSSISCSVTMLSFFYKLPFSWSYCIGTLIFFGINLESHETKYKSPSKSDPAIYEVIGLSPTEGNTNKFIKFSNLFILFLSLSFNVLEETAFIFLTSPI